MRLERELVGCATDRLRLAQAIAIIGVGRAQRRDGRPATGEGGMSEARQVARSVISVVGGVAIKARWGGGGSLIGGVGDGRKLVVAIIRGDRLVVIDLAYWDGLLDDFLSAVTSPLPFSSFR